MARTLLLTLLLLTAGCNHDSGAIIEPPRDRFQGAVEVSDAHVHLTLDAAVAAFDPSSPHQATDGGVFLTSGVENIGTRTIRYEDGGCGCPTPTPLMFDPEGQLCPAGPGPLCPCWNQTLYLAPGEGFVTGEGWICGEGTASVAFAYSVFQDGVWKERSLELHLPVQPGN